MLTGVAAFSHCFIILLTKSMTTPPKQTGLSAFVGGSFRQFLWQVVRELQSTILPILMPCPSGASGINHGKYILAPGPMSFSEEKLLQFFGQVIPT